MDSQAGAPPDAFAEDGQNWGFPTYNWEEMEKDGYAWWKARLGKMAQYFDAFRIDHILGFFRIWEIPVPNKSGLLGHFSPALPYPEEELRSLGFDPHVGIGTDVLFVEDPRRPGWWHPRISGNKTAHYAALPPELQHRYDKLSEDFFWFRHNDFWRECAMRKLPALLRSTGMLSCGEDLGMIPGCVPSVMEDLNILSLEIQRMPKDPADAFARPDQYPYWCVCATGTHDTSPLRAWWEEDRGLTQRYYNEMLGCEGDAPYFCEPWVADLILAQHMKSPAMLAILPLQDYLAADGDIRYQGNPADERINIPAIPRHYWRYRMHCTLESLIANDKFNGHIRTLVEAAARNR
jgi:4-alpha-glucanotransferase